MPYNPAVHHRRSIRLQNYDYSSAGAYFVTIVVKDRACVLAEIVDGEIRLSEIGQAVQEAWESLPARYPGVELDASVIMPNHTHGIIVITEAVGAVHVGAVHVRAVHEPPQPQDRRRMLLPKIVGFFKMNSAKRANLLLEGSGGAFWQRDYYEHIIRDEADLERIRAYIIANPLRWENDQLHPPVGAVHEPPLR